MPCAPRVCAGSRGKRAGARTGDAYAVDITVAERREHAPGVLAAGEADETAGGRAALLAGAELIIARRADRAWAVSLQAGRRRRPRLTLCCVAGGTPVASRVSRLLRYGPGTP